MSDVDDLAADARGSSLAVTYQTVTDFDWNPCGVYDPRFVISLATQQFWYARCRRNTCVHCLPLNARRRALAITNSSPRRMLRFSMVAPAGHPDPLYAARIGMKQLRQALKRLRASPGHWTWTIERNPRETGFHAHAVQHGPSIDQRMLQEAAARVGWGIPWIRAIRGRPGPTERYGLKAFGADGYGLKSFRAAEWAYDALDINGGRIEHHTPEFYMDEGEKIGVREAEKRAIAERYGAESGGYLVVNSRTARYYASPEGRNYLPKPLPR